MMEIIMTSILKETIIQKLKKIFSERKEITAVYVFGSRAGDFAGRQSDLDLAVMVADREKISERELLKFLINKGIKLPFSLDLCCVDLSSSPLFLYQIIKNGVCIYEKDYFGRVVLEGKILDIYYDTQHLRDIYNYYQKKSLKEGTYGY